MHKVGLALLAGSCALAAAPAEAQTRPGFEIGAELFDYSYRERFEGETVVRDDGPFGGVTVSYVETVGGGWFLRGRLSADFGSVDYESDDGSQIDDVSQDIGQLELQIGRDLAIGGGATLTPFAGLGSRVLNDHSGGEMSSDGLFGYDREISYAYVPFGLAAGIPVGGDARLTLSGQYNWVAGGEARSEFSGIDPALPDVTLDLDGGHGLEASAILALPVGRHAIAFGPFVRHWNIDRSESAIFVNPDDPSEAVELFEPKNRSTEIGVRLSFAF